MSHSGATPEQTAREFATRFGDEAFADAVALLSDAGRERVVEAFPEWFHKGRLDARDALEQYWTGLYCQYGGFESVAAVSGESGEMSVELEFTDGAERATIDVGEDGVTAFSFSPAYELPEYVDTDAFREREVTVDAGDVQLDGFLTVPDDDGPFPGTVLVHGQGVHDPDGSDGAAKIFRDLAWGLASEGIAVLRYEHRLNDHEVTNENYTLDTVVTDDAVAATETLAGAPEVDEDEAFVVGHSLGGMCAPRVAGRYRNGAGVVALDPPASTDPDPENLVYMRYAMEPDGDLDEKQQAELDANRETERRLAAGDFEDDEQVMGKPGVWHRSLHAYDPRATASDLDSPVLVMSGGRTDRERQTELYEWLRGRFERWQSADLPAGSRTEFYETVCHWFQDGPAPVEPIRLYFGGNVAGYVVADMADWVHSVAGT